MTTVSIADQIIISTAIEARAVGAYTAADMIQALHIERDQAIMRANQAEARLAEIQTPSEEQVDAVAARIMQEAHPGIEWAKQGDLAKTIYRRRARHALDLVHSSTKED